MATSLATAIVSFWSAHMSQDKPVLSRARIEAIRNLGPSMLNNEAWEELCDLALSALARQGSADLRWTLAALDLVKNALVSAGFKPDSSALHNLSVAVSIINEILLPAPQQQGTDGPASGSPDIAALVGDLQKEIEYHRLHGFPQTVARLGNAIQALRALDAERYRILKTHKTLMKEADDRNDALQHEADRLRGWLKDALEIALQFPKFEPLTCPKCGPISIGSASFAIKDNTTICYQCGHSWIPKDARAEDAKISSE